MLLVTGENDYMLSEENIEKLMDVLPEKGVKHVRIEDYNHIDYMWASDVDTMINPYILEFLR